MEAVGVGGVQKEKKRSMARILISPCWSSSFPMNHVAEPLHSGRPGMLPHQGIVEGGGVQLGKSSLFHIVAA